MNMVVQSRLLFWIVFHIILTGCSSGKSVESVFPNSKPECSPTEIAGEYLVRWTTGEVTLERGGDRESFKRDFVKTKLASLDYVEPNIHIDLKPTKDGSGFDLTALVNNWGADRVNAADAWAKGARGGGVTVAVVDTGIDLNHPQLLNQIAYNVGESGSDSLGRDKSSNGVDDDHNGFVDDYAGYNFLRNTGDPQDEGEHGSHVSGIIAGEHFDSSAGARSYIQGVAPEAKIIPLAFLGPSGGDLFAGMRAIDYAVKRGVSAINASWGGNICSTLLRDQIVSLVQKNIVFVVAAGNSGRDLERFPEYPAAFNLPSQITVGSIGQSNLRSDFSNYGSELVHIYAPGWDIVSSVPFNTYESMSGTSMATPFVTGAVAILRGSRPQSTISQIRQALYLSANKESFYQNASRGRLNVGAALSELLRMLPD